MRSTRNQARARAYLERNGFLCMVPGCGSSMGAQVHHIQPLSRGGSDEEENYIVLCSRCHLKTDVHADWQSWAVTLLTWKFYYEMEGSCTEESLPNVPIATNPSPERTEGTSSVPRHAASGPTERPSIVKSLTAWPKQRKVSTRQEGVYEELLQIGTRAREMSVVVIEKAALCSDSEWEATMAALDEAEAAIAKAKGTRQ